MKDQRKLLEELYVVAAMKNHPAFQPFAIHILRAACIHPSEEETRKLAHLERKDSVEGKRETR